jgi:class 3 adenylate cyclase
LLSELTTETRYAQAPDGTYVAYQLLGEGQHDLVLAMGSGIPVEDQMEGRQCASFIRRLASFARVIRFDRHGVGMSDPLLVESTLEQWVDDALVVLNEVGSQRAAFFGSDPAGSALAMMFAASHPERVTHLVLFAATARFMRAADYPWGFDSDELDRRLDTVMTSRLMGQPPPIFLNPNVSGDAEFGKWFVRATRRGLSPTRARTSFEAMWRSDLRSIVPAITAPTLLLHPAARHDLEAHIRYLAEHLRDARSVGVDGEDLNAFVGDVATVVDEVEEFLTGVRSRIEQDRVLATVLFSDIVESTAQATALGDRAWRQRLDAHDAMIRGLLEQFRGREVKATGDGFLATFDGPARAIRCGCAIRDGAAQLGISVRVGLHSGEVEVRGDDIGGIAVHTAARVQAHAQPDEICVSRTVVDLVAGSGINFGDRGEHELKGIPGTWQLFAVEV